MNTKQAEWSQQLLAAAEALLEARECEMVTAVEWRALAEAVAAARADQTKPEIAPSGEGTG